MRVRNIAIVAGIAAAVVIVSGFGLSHAYWGDGQPFCLGTNRWCF